MKSLREMIWDATTRIVADTIALLSPRRAVEYRAARESYKRAYVAARLTGPYQLNRPTNKSGDAEVLAARQLVTANVRDMARNNPLVAGMLYKLPTMTIGDEVGFKAQIALPNGKPNRPLNAEIERRFYRWAEACGIAGESLTDCAYLIESHLLQDGEILQKDVTTGEAGAGNPYRIQILETDYLDPSAGIHGVFYDALGRPVAYQVYNRHPHGVTEAGKAESLKSARMAAKPFRLLVESDRASQKRGISRFAPAVYKLNGVDDLEDAELVASRSAAAFGLIVTQPLQAEWNPYAGTSGAEDSPTDANGKKREYLESGGVYQAMPGEEVKAFSSDRPNSNFDSFTRGRKRDSSGSVGMSYESATGDYSQVNYSSARLGRIVEWGTIKRRQRRLRAWLKAVYREWLRYEISTVGIPGLSADMTGVVPPQLEECSFQLAGNDGIDPLKEIKAFESEIELCVQSRTDWCAERGRDFPELVAKLAEEKRILEEADLWQQDPVVQTSGFIAEQPKKQEETTDDEEA